MVIKPPAESGKARVAVWWDGLDLPRASVAELRKAAASSSGLVLLAGADRERAALAAEAVARERGVALRRVDLAAVAGKYAGETEKQLSRAFAEAADAKAVLLFDEADALFGKRGEVKDAHDRYANVEANQLLAHLDSHPGIVFVAGERAAIDPALLRRFRQVIDLS